MHKVRVYNHVERHPNYMKCEVDGTPVHARSIDFHAVVDSVPSFTIGVWGMPDIEVEGDVKFKFTPRTIEEALQIIEAELPKDTDMSDTVAVAETICKLYKKLGIG